MADPEPAKGLLPYLQRADELQKHDPLISYYCRMYAVDKGIKIPKAQRTQTTNDLLKSILIQLEKDKKAVKLNEQDDPMYVEGFALNVFAKADKQDRAGKADLNTAKTFYAASIFFDMLRQFGELHPDIAEKQKYAVWKAADIRAALRDGRKPMAGPPGGDATMDQDDSLASSQAPSLDRPVSFSDNLPSIPPPQPPSEAFNGFSLSHPPPEQSGGPHDQPPFPGMRTGGPPPQGPPPGGLSYPSFDSFKHSFHNPLGGNFGQRPQPHEPPSAPDMGPRPPPRVFPGGDPSAPSFHNPLGGNFAQKPQHGYGGPPPPGGAGYQVPPPPASSSGYPSIPPRNSTPPPVLPSVPSRAPQPVGGGQSYFSGVQMPNPVPGYTPTPDRVLEAQKLGRFAVSALGFDDVQPAIKYLTQALTLLMVPNADIGEIK
ncbi:vacuolar protein sorting-associated protein VTA1 [Klebsormidium nitens]|uniref:Vacuolar protein sorting-associated protein VTA1 n=1 Tax=Klebsormidium nitens TaxID=105231 RepID=A0A1Y1HV65_KLENI|nr:vacuolar protein sorting-associated protein VTA1 [Klebsormidium nitens]|eukprot:GAQ79728.1 vacuolar protein sorting-associated protein VTA1 [Klebsormidium nitens]